MPARARALIFSAPGKLRIEDVDVADVSEGEVLVLTRWSGISAGSELLAYRGQVDAAVQLDERLDALSGTFGYPFRYGYACVGRVEASRASGLCPGDLVFAFHPHQDRILVDARDVVPLDGAAGRESVLFASLETALQLSLDSGGVQAERVVVLGLGAVGLLTAMLLHRGGALVLAADPQVFRRELAGSLGVRSVAPADVVAEVADWTSGEGVALVVEASGHPSALRQALDLLAHEGTALVASWYGVQPVSLPLGGAFHRRRLHIRSSQVSSIPAELSGRWSLQRRRQRTVALLAELPMAALLTDEYPFEQAPVAYADLAAGRRPMMCTTLRYD